jgi:hypothetical protein
LFLFFLFFSVNGLLIFLISFLKTKPRVTSTGDVSSCEDKNEREKDKICIIDAKKNDFSKSIVKNKIITTTLLPIHPEKKVNLIPSLITTVKITKTLIKSNLFARQLRMFYFSEKEPTSIYVNAGEEIMIQRDLSNKDLFFIKPDLTILSLVKAPNNEHIYKNIKNNEILLMPISGVIYLDNAFISVNYMKNIEIIINGGNRLLTFHLKVDDQKT